MKLESKTALITGGASGIGKATALCFAREGAEVAIADLNLEKGKNACIEIEKFNRSALAVEVDVADEESVQHSVQAVLERFGRIDILVNNAGISWVKPFFEVSSKDWDRMIRIHLYGCFYFSQAVSRVMIDQGRGGKILNMASITGFRGSTGRGAYGAAKAGVINFTRYLSVELAPHNINVNAIAPGPILTPLIEKLWEQIKDYPRDIPLKRFGKPDEVASAALFLCSSDASYITGQILAVDGGFLAAGQIDRTLPSDSN